MYTSKITRKLISFILCVTFITGQAWAGYTMPDLSQDKLSLSLASDQSIKTGRSVAVREAVAEKLEPGAIGNGAPLRELAQGKLPSRITVPFPDELAKIHGKINDAINVAGRLTLANGEKLSEENQQRAKKAILNMLLLRDHLSQGLYLFNADVRGVEDYLLGFNLLQKDELTVGLSFELIERLYAISPLRLAQYVFHECVPEEGIITDRADHRVVYNEIQTVIFGKNEVEALKGDFRAFIDNYRSVTDVRDVVSSEKAITELRAAEESLRAAIENEGRADAAAMAKQYQDVSLMAALSNARTNLNTARIVRDQKEAALRAAMERNYEIDPSIAKQKISDILRQSALIPGSGICAYTNSDLLNESDDWKLAKIIDVLPELANFNPFQLRQILLEFVKSGIVVMERFPGMQIFKIGAGAVQTPEDLNWLPKNFNGEKYLRVVLEKASFISSSTVTYSGGEGEYFARIVHESGKTAELCLSLMEGKNRGKNRTWVYFAIASGGTIKSDDFPIRLGSVHNGTRSREWLPDRLAVALKHIDVYFAQKPATTEEISNDLPLRAKGFAANLKKILADHPDQVFFMGVEDDIGQAQKSSIMPLYSGAIDEIKELKDDTGKLLFPNLVVERGNAAKLVQIASGLVKEGRLNLNNAFIGARKLNVDNHAYDSIKGVDRAWISAIDDSSAGDYLPIFESITLNMMKYLNADITAIKRFYDSIAKEPISEYDLEEMLHNRIVYILPKATAFDGKQLRALYELAHQVYVAA